MVDGTDRLPGCADCAGSVNGRSSSSSLISEAALENPACFEVCVDHCNTRPNSDFLVVCRFAGSACFSKI
jgi:hypothetical protein